MFPLLYPGIWGAVGTNDAAIYLCEYIMDIDEIPEVLMPIKNALSSWFAVRSAGFNRVLTSKVEDYPNLGMDEVGVEAKYIWRIASRVSPNPNSPNGVDLPVTADGKWIPEIREKWRDFSISDPKTIEKYRDELSKLSLNITVVSKSPNWLSVAYENEYFVENLQSVGIPVNRMEMPGNHLDYIDERFIALVENMLGGLNIVSVDSKGKVATTWGNIKSNN